MTKTKVFLIVIISLFVGGFVSIRALDISEIEECNKWVRDAEQFSGFYLTDYEVEQCEAHGIEVNVQTQNEELFN